MSTFFAKHADTFATITTIILAFVALVSLMDQRFNAQEKLINQRFETINQRFDAQDRRIDDLEADIEQRFDAQDRYIDQGFVAVNQRLDQLTVETSELRKLTTGIVERVSRNEGEIDVIREQIRAVDAPVP